MILELREKEREHGRSKIQRTEHARRPILPRILQFTLPLAATGMLQLLFNAADVIVVGKFSGSIALAAVGATSTLVNLIVNTFIGISVGVNILVARRIGCHDADGVSRASHCAVALSALLGLLVMAIGLLFSRPMLEWMETPADILEKSTLYLKLYFLGVPFTLIYNFGAAILRAYGDTRRPLIYLTVSGVVNALLNLFFVIVCKIDVAGVAIATVISQVISGSLSCAACCGLTAGRKFRCARSGSTAARPSR